VNRFRQFLACARIAWPAPGSKGDRRQHSSRKRTKHGKKRKKSRLFGFSKNVEVYAYSPENHGDHPQSVLLSFAQ